MKHHDSITGGHTGQYKTQGLIIWNYWWPGIQGDIWKYTEGCEPCQYMKTHQEKAHNPLHPNKVLNTPWEHISIDIIRELPESNGYNAILVKVDRFSKLIIVIPTNMELTAHGTAYIYHDHVWSKHGLPCKVISDRGSQFTAQFIKDLHKLTGVVANLSTAYHPQTDGQTEQINQEVEQYLWLFVNHRQSNWHKWLSCAEFSYNDKFQTSTRFSPFFINYRWHPYKGTNPGWQVKSQSAIEFAEQMKKIHEETKAALTMAQETMKCNYNKKKGRSQECKIGKKVWLEGTNISTDWPIKKLDNKWHGPFTIIRKEGESAYWLVLVWHVVSVAMVWTNVFWKKKIIVPGKFVKIMGIFGKIDNLENRGIISWL